jgi:hypothetical protein
MLSNGHEADERLASQMSQRRVSEQVFADGHAVLMGALAQLVDQSQRPESWVADVLRVLREHQLLRLEEIPEKLGRVECARLQCWGMALYEVLATGWVHAAQDVAERPF